MTKQLMDKTTNPSTMNLLLAPDKKLIKLLKATMGPPLKLLIMVRSSSFLDLDSYRDLHNFSPKLMIDAKVYISVFCFNQMI